MLAPKATTSAMCWPSQSMSDTMLQGLPSKRTPERRRAESTWPLTLARVLSKPRRVRVGMSSFSISERITRRLEA